MKHEPRHPRMALVTGATGAIGGAIARRLAATPGFRVVIVAFAECLRPHGVTVNACHPGDVRSRLAGNLGFGGHESPDEGARTPVWLATEEIGGKITGKYFEHQREIPCRFAADRAAIEALYAACLAYQ